jgi:serine/threonine protein kinase
MIGQVVDGRYEIVRQLGEGGMGTVYEAIHTGTGRRVAVKLILDEALHTPELVGRFQREARAAGAIDTEHIVQVIDMGTDRRTGAPFMAMEFLKGQDLQTLLAKFGPLPAELALAIIAQACVGLGKAHDAGIVHRDVKPGNIYLAERDGGDITVKVLDFGIAKIKMDQHLGASSDRVLTRTGSILGSPVYMSPEQAKGEKSIDHRSDLWSLGVVLYELLSGRAPHADQETLGKLIISICSGPPPSVQSYAPWIAPEVAAVVHGALALRPAERYQSAGEMLDAIRPLLPRGSQLSVSELQGLSGEVRALVAVKADAISVNTTKLSGSQAGMSVASNLSDAPTLVVPTFPPPAKPRRGRVAGVGLALVAGVIGAVVLVGTRRGNRVTTEQPPPAPPSAAPSVTEAPTVRAPIVTPSVPVALDESGARLVVIPPTATVEIDGESAPVRDGSVAVRGMPGSTHLVRVRQGGLEQTLEVVVTNDGVRPRMVELTGAAKSAGSARSGSKAAPSTPKRGASAAPPAEPAAPNISTKFE